ncbi:hypothetical protein B7994_01235 [Fibrobacter sp. UWR2]|nr:hypothetical protein B7994_01235 [Fibrobacter sp. UWR2]
MRSLRVHMNTPEGFSPGIIGAWHCDLMASFAAFRNRGVHALVSESRDGEILARAIERLGFEVTRGSDTHGALNVRHLVQTLRHGGFVGMALDGPRGPALQVKPGSPWLSEISGRPLWLVCPRYGAHFRLKTWDNFIVPLPLSSIDIQIKYFCKEETKTEKE